MTTSPKLLFFIFLRLGCTAFGGPVAHLAYFHEEFVKKRGWLSEEEFSELVALCQFLPGPASSQVGLAIGYKTLGYKGGILAWLGFTLPSAIILMLFAYGVTHYDALINTQSLHYLKLAALAVVAQAIWTMGNKLCTSQAHIIIALLSCAFILLFPFAFNQIVLILFAGLIGVLFFKENNAATPYQETLEKKNRAAKSAATNNSYLFLISFFALLFILPLLNLLSDNQIIAYIDSFYRTGALVFGGGHVVLPMLEAEMNTQQWLDKDSFLAGYAAAQAVPGPLFTFSAYLGSSFSHGLPFWATGLICLSAIFLPSFLLIFGIQPYWEKLRVNRSIKAVLQTINAAVVGLLLAAFYQPIWVNSVFNATDLAWGLIFFTLLRFYKVPAWLLIIIILIFSLLFL